MNTSFFIKILPVLIAVCFCMIAFGCGTSVKVTTANTTVPVMLGPVFEISGEKERLQNQNTEYFYIQAKNNRLLSGEQINEKSEKFDVELLKIGVPPDTFIILSQIQFRGYFTFIQSMSDIEAGMRGAVYNLEH